MFQTFLAISSHLSRKHPTHNLDLTHSLARTDSEYIVVQDMSSIERYEDNYYFFQQENNICRDMEPKFTLKNQLYSSFGTKGMTLCYSSSTRSWYWADQRNAKLLVENMKAKLKERLERKYLYLIIPNVLTVLITLLNLVLRVYSTSFVKNILVLW